MVTNTSTSRKAEDISPSPPRPPSILRKGGATGTGTANPIGETNATGQARSKKNKQAKGTATADTPPPKRKLYDFFDKVVSNTKAATPKTPTQTPPKEPNKEKETEKNGEEEVDFSGVNSVKMRPVSQKKKKRKKTNKKKDKEEEQLSDSSNEEDSSSEEEETPKSKTKKKTEVAKKTKAKEKKPKHFNHRYTVVVQCSARVGRVAKVKDAFNTKVLQGLTFLQTHVDETAAFLPKTAGSKMPQITGKATLPDIILVQNRNYFVQKNPYAFNSNNQSETGRTIKFSAIMGFNEDPQQVLDDARSDLMELGIGIYYKECQSVNTESRLLFLGAPNGMDREETKAIMEAVMKPLELRLMTEDPENYPAFMHGQSWPDFAVICDQPGGMPFEQTPAGQRRKGPPRERKCLTIMCATDDYERLSKLVYAAKGKGLWRKELGFCFPTETPDNTFSDPERERYVRMVETHASAQLSYGSAPIGGLRAAREDMELRRLPAADNSARPPATVSVKKVMQEMTLKTERLWICVGKTNQGRFTGYFPGGDGMTKAYVAEWLKCPGAQIYWYLIKRGFVKEDVVKFIKRCFDVTQQKLCSTSKYNTKTKLAYVIDATDEEDIVAAARHSFVDLDAGLSEDQRRQRHSEAEIVFGDAPKGSVEAYNFEDGQSLTSVRNKTAAKEDDSSSIASKSLGKTMFEPALSESEDTLSSKSSDDYEGSSGEEEEKESKKEGEVRFTNRNQVEKEAEVFEDAMEEEQEELSSTEKETADAEMEENLNKATEDLRDDMSEEEEEEESHLIKNPTTFAEHLWNIGGPSHGAMIILCDDLLDELGYEKLSEEWTMAVERHPFITTELREKLSIEAVSSSQTEENFVMEMRTALEQSTGKQQQPLSPEDKNEFQPEEGNSNDLHRSGSSPNNAVDKPAKGTEDTAAQDEDGTG